MKAFRRAAPAALSLALVVGLPSTAQAGHVACGAIITSNVTLDSDIGPCPGDGLVVTADNVTVDLNGHTISGTDGPADAGVGVRVTGNGVTVTNGTVTKFDAGVVIEGGAGNTVSLVTATDNRPGLLGGDYGDGVTIFGATADNNSVVDSVLRHNGPFGGVSVLGGNVNDKITGTVISGNLVQDNNLSPQDDGVRLENWTWNSTISDNVVLGSALEGIALFADTRFNTVTGNNVQNNGYGPPNGDRAPRPGDGIRSFARGGNHTIENNQVFGNAGNGIFLSGPLQMGGNPVTGGGTTVPGSTLNQVLSNDTGNNSGAPTKPVINFGNGVVHVTVTVRAHAEVGGLVVDYPTPPAPTYDLHDGNANCNSNVWSGNTYGTANPACTTAP